jgi:hypothetical protein
MLCEVVHYAFHTLSSPKRSEFVPRLVVGEQTYLLHLPCKVSVRFCSPYRLDEAVIFNHVWIPLEQQDKWSANVSNTNSVWSNGGPGSAQSWKLLVNR